ncbi:MAG: PAS domain S-box protein [Desulfobacula sp.]|uniref:PAS domain-containing sensor histidine kinase n=1 Tax=Desulfobacula sp. TaxID=2593537 RepID=UPI0025C17E0A|nr:PAS domain S-box protein [Desulfobacula sp.]MCD4719717.1 PAS domain S-box protein [Desulfobacula sp.]
MNNQYKKLSEALKKSQQHCLEIQKSEEKYRHLFEKSPVSIYITDRNGAILNINQACVNLFGYASSNLLCGKSIETFFVNPDDWKQYIAILNKNGFIREFETRLYHKNQNVFDVKMTAAIRDSLTGKLSGYEGFIIDITELKFNEKEHLKSEEKYRTVLENSLAGIYMFQEGGKFSYVNSRLIKMLGHGNDHDIIGRPFWEFIHPEDREMVQKRGLAREKGEIYPRHYPFRIIKKDGSILWVDMRSSHATYMGRPAVVGNFINITKIKQAEAQIRDLSRKLIDVIEEERKSLAADLHDEFGQALTSLRFDMEKLQQTFTDETKEEMRICNRVIAKISDLAEKIRTFTSKLRPDLLDHLGLVPTIEWYIKDFKKNMPQIKITFQAMGFKRRLAPNIEIVLYRIFQESLNNVLKHSKADQIDIKLTCSHPKVIFSCRDNGRGFKVTENGFPKEDTMGIGLLSMKERTDSLNGRFDLKSAKNIGTIVRVELPVLKDNKNEKDTNPHC